MNYFVITSSDGETQIEQMNGAELLKRLQPEDGEDEFCYYGKVEFLDKLDKDGVDPAYWTHGTLLIIRGEIVVPKPKDIVKTFYID